MGQFASLKRILVLVVMLLSLTAVAVAFAQEETAVPAETTAEEHTTEAAAADDHGAAAAEDDHSEAAAATTSTSPLTPLGINTGFLLAQILNFLVIIFIPALIFLWRPLTNMLDGRAAKIQKSLEDSAVAANARRNAEVEVEKVLADARTDAQRVVEEARSRGEEVAASIEADARTEADAIRAEARARANEERDRQLADLRGQVVAIAVAMSQRLIGDSLDEKRQQALVSDFFAKVPAEARQLSGSVEVVSAMPLSDAEQATVKQQVGGANVTFSVDPSILGGLVLRTEDRVVDGSVRSNLSELAGRLR
jgi:F-type H+-transporting ATPase subunit b